MCTTQHTEASQASGGLPVSESQVLSWVEAILQAEPRLPRVLPCGRQRDAHRQPRLVPSRLRLQAFVVVRAPHERGPMLGVAEVLQGYLVALLGSLQVGWQELEEPRHAQLLTLRRELGEAERGLRATKGGRKRRRPAPAALGREVEPSVS